MCISLLPFSIQANCCLKSYGELSILVLLFTFKHSDLTLIDEVESNLHLMCGSLILTRMTAA